MVINQYGCSVGIFGNAWTFENQTLQNVPNKPDLNTTLFQLFGLYERRLWLGERFYGLSLLLFFYFCVFSALLCVLFVPYFFACVERCVCAMQQCSVDCMCKLLYKSKCFVWYVLTAFDGLQAK